MKTHDRTRPNRRLRTLTRCVLTALATLVVAGIAFHGDSAKGVVDRPGAPSQADPVAPGPGVADELGKFAAVDMADALRRVVGAGAAQGDPGRESSD
jgi:hypothetical protein